MGDRMSTIERERKQKKQTRLLRTLAAYLPKHKKFISLSAEEVQEVFLFLYHDFLLFKLSLNDFSGLCGLLWTEAEKTHDPPTILWAELADVLHAASELKWCSRHATKNYSFFMNEIIAFADQNKKIGESKT